MTIYADGSVDYEERFGATLNAELDLSRFPFDQQALDMELQSFVWDRSEISLVRNQAQTGFDDEFETPEWSVTAVEGLIGAGMEVRDDREFSLQLLHVSGTCRTTIRDTTCCACSCRCFSSWVRPGSRSGNLRQSEYRIGCLCATDSGGDARSIVAPETVPRLELHPTFSPTWCSCSVTSPRSRSSRSASSCGDGDGTGWSASCETLTKPGRLRR